MIRKRSIHMPTTIVHEAMHVPVIVRSRLMARKGTGMMKLQTTMVQNIGAKCIAGCVVQKTAISEGALPYQAVSRSAEGEVEPEQAHGQQQLAEILKVNGLEIFLQMQELPQQRHGQNQRGDAAEDGAHDEVRAEDRRVPHGHRRHREVPGDDGVHRDGDRNDGDGHDVHGDFKALPLARRALPSQRKRPVDLLTQAGGGVADSGEVRNRGQIAEKCCCRSDTLRSRRSPRQAASGSWARYRARWGKESSSSQATDAQYGKAE